MDSWRIAAEVEGFTVQVGGQPRTQLVKTLSDAGVRLNAYAETLIAHPAFDAPVGKTLRIVERTVEQLDLTEGAVLSEVLVAARNQGLELCSAALITALLAEPAPTDAPALLGVILLIVLSFLLVTIGFRSLRATSAGLEND